MKQFIDRLETRIRELETALRGVLESPIGDVESLRAARDVLAKGHPPHSAGTSEAK